MFYTKSVSFFDKVNYNSVCAEHDLSFRTLKRVHKLAQTAKIMRHEIRKKFPAVLQINECFLYLLGLFIFAKKCSFYLQFFETMNNAFYIDCEKSYFFRFKRDQRFHNLFITTRKKYLFENEY